MIKFNKWRIPTITLSIVLILFSIWISLGIFFPQLKDINLGPATSKGYNLGIDFQGGIVHQVTIYSGISQEEVRAFAREAGLGSEVQNVEISEKRRIGKATSYLIKTIITKEEQEEITNNTDLTPTKFLGDRINKFYSLIKDKYGETYTLTGSELEQANKNYKNAITGEIVEQRTDDKRVLQNVVKESENVISPAYSKGLVKQSFFLVLFVLAAMLIYISFRFKFKFAVGAVAALLHDVTIILGVISITRLEFDYTIIAAILFIIGYSLNDTIVIFDRIRENFGIMKNDSSSVIINTSINQSLSRTIITSLTTLLAVIALYFLGGQKIERFAYTLIVGIICGTYSSIFIASPVVESWDKIFGDKATRLKEKKKEEKRIEQENIQNLPNPSNEEKPKIEQPQQQINVSLSKKQMKKLGSKKKKR